MKRLFSSTPQNLHRRNSRILSHQPKSSLPLRLLQAGRGRCYSIKATSLNKELETVEVEFGDGSRFHYPYLFLQDNCTCPSCFHPSSQSRLRKMTQLSLHNPIISTQPLSDNSSASIVCKWQDGHESTFTESWLLQRRFTPENSSTRKSNLRHEPQFISVENCPHSFSRNDFHQVFQHPEILLKMLKTLALNGAYLLEHAPAETGQLRKLADTIGFIRLTHYGHEFTVKSEPNAVNLAYTAGNLGVHTDLPYYVYPPGVQLLHCIKQYSSEDGGQSHLVDGFKVAMQMQNDFPQEYRTLCETPVEFYDVGQDYTTFFKVHHSPTFVLDNESKALTRIVYSNQQLSSYLPIEITQVKPFYKAIKTFTDLCYKKENLMEFKLKEGDILIFDNWRMLHGRRGFDQSKDHRHLEGCYIDWDEIFSRIRVIENELSSKA